MFALFSLYKNYISSLVQWEYHQENGIITFSVDENFYFSSIYSVAGNFSVPQYDENTKQITISLWEIPYSKNDSLHICIVNDNLDTYSFNYEINHCDNAFIEAFDYPYASNGFTKIFDNPYAPGQLRREYLTCECTFHDMYAK